MDRMKFIKLLTTRPAAILDLPAPSIEVGNSANITLVDPAFRCVYDPRTGQSRSHNSPWGGRLMTGKAVLTVYRGKTAYRDDSYFSSRKS
jgi:dihydroorotase